MPGRPKKAKSDTTILGGDLLATAANSNPPRTLDARPDTIDFRDQMYIPTLAEVPVEVPLGAYQKGGTPVLDQGAEGACAGFGLATVCNYLLRKRKVRPSGVSVSPWMLYQMAQQSDPHDASAGYATSSNPNVGASCRSAMKGWNQNGVCQSSFWPKAGPGKAMAELTADARKRPLGAYFRVNHKDLVAMHTALAEVRILYASALLHEGWYDVKKDGVIPFTENFIGGHAFAIVAFDQGGLWIQNSWGVKWGAGGYGYISYDDWLKNGTDVWVARLGVPIELHQVASVATIHSSLNVQSSNYATPELAPHIISIGDDGFLKQNGQWSKSEEQVRDVFREQFREETEKWSKKRLVLYAHGGLVSEGTAVDRIGWYWSNLKTREMYLVGFVWHTDYLSTLGNILRDAVSQVRPEGILDSAKDFLLDRLDDTLEPIARVATGKLEWDKMKTNALAATEEDKGGARIAALGIKDYYDGLSAEEKAGFEIHLVGHSAGSIFLAPLIEYLTGELALTIESCTLWAPACTMDVFRKFYVPAVEAVPKKIKRFTLFTLDDATERADDCAGIYHKSLLYLVSDAFERRIRVPLIHPDGEPLLGMEKFVAKTVLPSGGSPTVEQWLKKDGLQWIKSPNQQRKGTADAAGARHHGDFSTDEAVLLATIARIANQAAADEEMGKLTPSTSEAQSTREAIQVS